MNKYIKKLVFTVSIIILSMLILSVCAYADYTGEANVSSYIRTGDGNIIEWNDESCRPAVNATKIDLAGIYIYAPRGYYVYSAELNGQDILKYSQASATTTEIIVPAVTFTYNEYNTAPIHLTYGEEQNLNITYAPIVEDTDILVTYTAGVNELPSSLREQHVFQAENGVHIVKGMGQEFAVETPAGWLPGTMKLIYPNGSSIEVYSGQRITPYQSCTVQIVYVLPVTVSVKPGLSANYGDELPTGSDAFTYTVSPTVDSSGITVEADVEYASNAVGTQGVYLSNVRVLKNGNELNANELRLSVYNGAIIIRRSPLVITAGSQEKTYDGAPLADSSFTADALKNGDTIEHIVANCSITAAGTTDNIIYGAVIMNDGRDVTANYEVSYVSGTLTVNPAPISISAIDCTMVYNGHPQSSDEYHIVGNLAEGDRLSVTSSGTATYVSDGKVTSVPSAVTIYNSLGQDVSRCYDITLDTETAGSLSIVPRPITVTANSRSFTYTGSEITAESCGAFVSEDTPLADTDMLESADASGKLRFVGETAITVSNAVITSGGVDVTDNYSITYNPGRLSVVPAPGKGTITITLGGTKVYDGTSLENAFEWEADELAAQRIASVKVDGTTIGPAVASREISAENASVKLYDEKGELLDNADFNIEIFGGTVSITKQNLKISPTDATKKYDGRAYIGSIVREGTLSSGLKVTVSATTYPYNGSSKVNGIAVGTYTLRVEPSSVKVTDSSGRDISSNFNISYDEAVLKVTASVTTANYSRASGGTVTINCSVSPSDLTSVSIDGTVLVKGTDYSVANGSATLVTFVNAYLKNLSTGNHTLVLSYGNAGTVTTTISVSDAGKTTSSAMAGIIKK